ncbi:MAG: glycosyltransferase [Candidatus Margulisiibacteriota bacterium]
MLVSVIIPTFNRPKFTEEAVASVRAQSFRDFELIVVEKEGVSAARNFGVSVSNGKYIAFLDSDDLWEKRKLEKQLKYLKDHPEFKICYTNETWIRNGAHLNQLKRHQKYHGLIFDKCLPLCIISASSILMERAVFDALGGFDESLPVCEDYDLWLRLALRYPIAYLDEKLIIKRGGHPDQLSHRYWGMDRFRIQALNKLLKNEKLTLDQRDLIVQEMGKKYKVLLDGAWKRGRLFYWVYLLVLSKIFSPHPSMH